LEKKVGLSEEVQTAAGLRSDQAIMMWNPPWTLFVAMPFGLLEFAVARRVWFVLHLLLILGCADWLWCFYGGPARRRWLVWLLAITFYPSVVVLGLGQITPLLLLSMVGFLHFEKLGNGWAAGAFTAIAAVKPHLVFLFWPALLLWAIHGRRWSVLCGGSIAGLVATAVPLACNPALLQEYWFALRNLRNPSDALSPTLGTVLRLAFGEENIWLHLVPSVLGVTWLVYYWLRNRSDWVWADRLPLIVLVSFLTAAYGAWACDRVVLLVPVVQAAIWIVQSDHWPVRLSGLAVFLTVSALPPILFVIESSGIAGQRVPQSTIELTLGYMTPALLLVYLLFACHKYCEVSTDCRSVPAEEAFS
jgi:hypothetical protein